MQVAEPRYSILIYRHSYREFADRIETWLGSGIKVIWINNDEFSCRELRSKFPGYIDAFMLQVYQVDANADSKPDIIIDGNDDNRLVETILQQEVPVFNAAQYQVEHCVKDRHIIVQASAGTGKTSVMIDRIMYLLHMDEGLNLKDVYMITFTRDAAAQMGSRLRNALMTRYRLTSNARYLRWLEELSQMNISTIHSFTYNMLSKLGVEESFTSDLNIGSLRYEKQELVRDLVDEYMQERQIKISTNKYMGIGYHDVCNAILTYWDKLKQLGILHEEIANLNWGEAGDNDVLQNVFKEIIPRLDREYRNIQKQNHTVEISDLMRDLYSVLNNIISCGQDLTLTTDIRIKYLFVDEFQDSDIVQSEIVCQIIQIFCSKLFIVGDEKQSIYSFRGANENAFRELILKLNKLGVPQSGVAEFILINNYRTAKAVMRDMEHYFIDWSKCGRIHYSSFVNPLINREGAMTTFRIDDVVERKERVVEIVGRELARLTAEVESGEKDSNEQNRIVLLARNNADARELSRMLNDAKIPTEYVEEGSFFRSDAVRDFYALISSFVYSEEPKYIYNYLITPYAAFPDKININDMERLNGDKDMLTVYLDNFLNQTNWKEYHKKFRLRPIMSVIKEIYDNEPVVDNYVAAIKAEKISEGYSERSCNVYAYNRGRQYQANLQKLMIMLEEELNSAMRSLHDIYSFLKINIATNVTEGEAEIVRDKTYRDNQYKSVECMTVHKAKGLEFDTVIIPYMDRKYVTRPANEIIVGSDKSTVGWNYTTYESGKPRKKYKNCNYQMLKEWDNEARRNEEARILYVAMTRTINHLVCIVTDKGSDKNNKDTWCELMLKRGNYE